MGRRPEACRGGSSNLTGSEVEREVEKIEAKYPLLKAFRFAIAGAAGYGVTEAVLTIGILLVYGKLTVPHASSSSIGLVSLDILSLAVGVTVSFLINERITVNVHKETAKPENRLRRFLKFQGVSGVGNAGIIVVQLILLTAFDISPLLGTIIGAVVTYPVVYFISINYVWKAHQLR